MVKKGSSFAKIAVLFVALLMGLSLMGAGFSYWSDTLIISGTVEMGYIDVQLSEGTGVPSENVTGLIDGHTIGIEINAGGAGNYYYNDFDIHNTGTIPVIIEDIEILTSPPFTATIIGSDVEIGDQIEQNGVAGDTVYGTVKLTVPSAGSYTCDVTFYFIQWNLYSP